MNKFANARKFLSFTLLIAFTLLNVAPFQAQKKLPLNSGDYKSNAEVVEQTLTDDPAVKARQSGVRLFNIDSAAKLNGKVYSIAARNQSAINIIPKAIDFSRALRFEIPMPGGKVFDAERRVSEGFVRHNDDSFSWNGAISDGDFVGDVILSISKGAVSGLIYTPQGTFEIIPQAGGAHVLVEIDSSLFPPAHPDDYIDKVLKQKPTNPVEPILNKVLTNESSGGAAFDSTENKLLAPLAPTDTNTIEILVVYSAAVKNFLGGAAQADAFALNSVNLANTAYLNSVMTTRLRLIRALEVPYPDTSSDNVVALNWVKSNPEVAALRNFYKADLVAIFTQNANFYCGVADLMLRNENSTATQAKGFSTTARACAVSDLVFAHEIGHNQGAQHDYAPPGAGGGANGPNVA